jgi:hypothetical protein
MREIRVRYKNMRERKESYMKRESCRGIMKRERDRQVDRQTEGISVMSSCGVNLHGAAVC